MAAKTYGWMTEKGCRVSERANCNLLGNFKTVRPIYMTDKLMYIPNDDTQNYAFCR